MLGALSGLFAYHADQNMLIRWIYSTLAVMLVGAAFMFLIHDDAIKVAAESGESWITHINSATPTLAKIEKLA